MNKILIFILLTISIFIILNKSIYIINYKKEIIEQYTFYYTNQEQLNLIDNIMTEMNNFKKNSSSVFSNEILASNVYIYLEDSKSVKKNKEFKHLVTGYSSKNSITILTGKVMVELPNGNSYTYQNPNQIQTFYHEYTHVLLYKSTYKILPHWFSEGLADYMSHSVISKQAKESQTLLNFEEIINDDNWDKYPLDILYSSSEYYIKRIISIWGESCIKEVIKNISKDEDFVCALEKATGQSYSTIIKILMST